MKFIVDTNVLISALLRDSFTRKIILKNDFELFVIDYSLIELENYEEYILRKTSLSKTEYVFLVKKLISCMKSISLEKNSLYYSQAKILLEDIDPDDVPFISSALEHDAILWSDDKALKKQQVVRVINTQEVCGLVK